MLNARVKLISGFKIFFPLFKLAKVLHKLINLLNFYMIIYAIMFLLTYLHINIIDKNLEIFLNVMSIFTAPSSLDKYQQINVVF